MSTLERGQTVLQQLEQLLSHDTSVVELAPAKLVEALLIALPTLGTEALNKIYQIFNEATLPSVQMKPYQQFDLKVAETFLGRQVTFTIPAGMSGAQVLERIELANPRGPGDGVVWPESKLLNDPGLSIAADENKTYSFIVCRYSGNLTPAAQEAYLKEHGLEQIDCWLITLGAALYRDMIGFPEKREDIGTSDDAGDLCEGKYIRTRSGVLACSDDGLNARDVPDYYAHDLILVAGGVPSLN
jgi:hypothetical protein